jgi:hypothetical protein
VTDEGRTIKIERVQVGYTVETGDGPERKAVTLGALRRHCRTERVADLIEDLELLCQDVETGRRPDDQGRPPLSLVRRPV